MTRPNLSDEGYCIAIRQAARYVTQQYERHLGQVGLTPAQYTILTRLQRNPWQSMQALSQELVMERTTLVRAMQPLQRAGLVATRPAAHDARVLSLALSDAGALRLEAARSHWREAQAEFEHTFGRQRAALLRGELFAITHGGAGADDDSSQDR